MKLQIKYDIHQACKTIMQEQLRKMGIDHEIGGIGEITLKTALSKTQLQELETAIKKYGIEIIDNPRNTFVQKVKDLIVEMIYLEDELPNVVPFLLVNRKGPAFRRASLLDCVIVARRTVGFDGIAMQQVGVSDALRSMHFGPVIHPAHFGPTFLS